MSHATPLPGVPAQSANDKEKKEHIVSFQAAMYRVHDALQRVGSQPEGTDLRLSGLSYIDGQLRRCQLDLDNARSSLTSIMAIVTEDDEERDPFLPSDVALNIGTPDGSGRNAGGAL